MVRDGLRRYLGSFFEDLCLALRCILDAVSEVLDLLPLLGWGLAMGPECNG